ncbi:Epoxide hydrolase 2 [Quillaja saponaria]|uniref:Epoxide hydrolase 2 n=1 Tax=Quillaja saponaria TaxID=32244 RepID=A0AAD7Q1U3_QUISA|nr:Epoxide hydrolase 2 [Quillaja saponaria]
MEGIEHRMVDVNGIRMHIAEKGQGPIVLFLHGFPELWYSWRHQILALSSLGYHAVAPDLRGYDQIFLVAHDWGAFIGWHLCLFRPDRIKAYVCLSIPFIPRNPNIKPLDGWNAHFGEDYYICRFQEPGKMEAELAKIGIAQTLKSFFAIRKPGALILPKDNGFNIDPETPKTLPSWLSEEDLAYYASKFEQKGFTPGLNYYRNFNSNWELTAPWTGAQVKVPVKFIVGDLDMVYTTPGFKEYIHNGDFKKDVPNLEEVVVMESVAHFNNQERPEEISNHIYDFIKKF